MRYIPFLSILIITLVALAWCLLAPVWVSWLLLCLAGPLALIGIYDLLQRRHTLLRNYPVVGHLRWQLEAIRPQVQQYFVEPDTEGRPFNRNERALVYQRAKNELDKQPFGTELDVYTAGFEWINHSIDAHTDHDMPLRIDIGNEQCSKPYSASLYNISAMSFGALGAAAIRALNRGAKLGNFAHDTGEGGISRYHREFGGDLIWEIGSGYFGCRDQNGRFEEVTFREQATTDQVKMIELKLSQGAKPSHGGILPAAKITPEIATARHVPMGQDCVSPARHSTFNTPIEMLEFIARLRELSGGKPTGFKLCVGNRWEVMAIAKAMQQTGIYPDFIVVDGAEGGTGAAPLEHANRIGMPLREGLLFVHNTLVASGLRKHVRIGASGKVITACHLAINLALGADWCNSARGFMFALGCVQSMHCHTNHCPTGVTTQNLWRQRGLDVTDKAQRVCNYHRHMLNTLRQVLGSAGVSSAGEFGPQHVCQRVSETEIRTLDCAYPFLEPGALEDGSAPEEYRRFWQVAQSDSFAPQPV